MKYLERKLDSFAARLLRFSRTPQVLRATTLAFCAIRTVHLLSLLNDDLTFCFLFQKNASQAPESDIKWAVACSSITFGCSAVVVLAHLITFLGSIFVGTRIEGVLTFILAGFWAATVAIVTSASNGVGIGVLSNSVQVSSPLVVAGLR